MVCETNATARRFAEIGRELPKIVGVYGDVLKKPLHGEASPWKRDGARVKVDHLKDIPLWSKAHYERMQCLLVESIDLEL